MWRRNSWNGAVFGALPLRLSARTSARLAVKVPPSISVDAACPKPLSNLHQQRRWGSTIAGSYQPTETPITQVDKPLQQPTLGLVIKPQSTLVDLWDQAFKAFGPRRFVGTKMWVRGRLGYVWASYESIAQEAECLRTLLSKMGVVKGSRVVIVSENRYEWIVVHIATLQLGAQFVCLPTNATPHEAKTVVISTLAKVLFVESMASYAVVKGWIGTVGALEHVFCFEDQNGEASYAVAINVASAAPEKAPIANGLSSEDTAVIMFTAGTTGPPKGVMLSHKSLVANVSSVFAVVGEAITEHDIYMSLCPWTVAGSLSTELYQAVCKGASICIPPELLEGFHDLEVVNPTVIVSVAQPFNRAFANITDDISKRRSVVRDATKFTLGRLSENRMMLKKPSPVLQFFSRMTLGRFKRQFGSQLRVAIIVGHPIPREQEEVFADLDLYVVNTYGCLEAGGLIATDLEVPSKLKILPGVEVRVVNEHNEIVSPGDIGEILIEAPHAMQGYFDVHITPDEAKNSLVAYGARSFVRTGDYGSITGGWLTLKGHKDVLITLSNGFVVDPLVVETALIKSPFIKQAFVFGERRAYLVALLVPNVNAIASHLKKIERRDGTPIVSDREKAECLRAEIRRVSKDLPARSWVRRFALVDEFSLAKGFLTCKYGFARDKIERHYANYLNALYDETPKFFGYAVDDYDDLF